jgi:hypothetical protein
MISKVPLLRIMASDLHNLEILCHNVDNAALASRADLIPQPPGSHQVALPVDQGCEPWLTAHNSHRYIYIHMNRYIGARDNNGLSLSRWTAEANVLPFAIRHGLCSLSLPCCLSTPSPHDTAARPEGATHTKGIESWIRPLHIINMLE